MKIYVKGKTNETAATLSPGQISGVSSLLRGFPLEIPTDASDFLTSQRIPDPVLKVEEDQTETNGNWYSIPLL